MENPKASHLNVGKRLLRYAKGIINYDIFYSSRKKLYHVGFSKSDWVRKSTMRFLFQLSESAIIWSSKK